MNKSHLHSDPAQGDTSLDTQLAEITDDFLDRIGRGENPDVLEYVQDHPELADVLRQMLPALAAIHFSGSDDLSSDVVPDSEEPVIGRLGDFRLLHEIGRGGMGVVYEAEQISIGRRVALKVLPFAGVLDERQLARFKNESRAAGSLNHPNIVPVHAVGSERGVHYYAMQYVEGQSLAEVIADLRGDKDDSSDVVPTDVETKPVAALSTERQTDSGAFFRRVARLGLQAAEALDHAHGVGIVHRDIKPSNLMVDTTGKLLITDFGLAQIEGAGNLTMTGDLVGTLRYMSPEQAAGDRAVLDHRADIYSLGITLYELLTLRPAFEGSDKAKLLRDILEHEPPPPRSINSAIPRDLETIVLKAISKDPADRYSTSAQLVGDLQSFLEGRPIKARRPGPVERVVRWTKRNRAGVWVVGSFMLLLVVASVVSSLGWNAAIHERKNAEQARIDAEDTLEENEKLFVELAKLTELTDGLEGGELSPEDLVKRANVAAENLRKPVALTRFYKLLGTRQRREGRFADADRSFIRSEEALKNVNSDDLGPYHTVWLFVDRARVRMAFKNFEEAEPFYRKSVEVPHFFAAERMWIQSEWAFCLGQLGKSQESRQLYGQIAAQIDRHLSIDRFVGGRNIVFSIFATAALSGGKTIDYAEEERRLAECMAGTTSPGGILHWIVPRARLHDAMGNDQIAIEFYDKAVQLRQFYDLPFDEPRPMDWIEWRLAELLEQSGQSGNEIAVKMSQWNVVREKVLLPDHPAIAFGKIRLAKWMQQHSLPGSGEHLQKAKSILAPQNFTPKRVLDEIEALIENTR